jgi:hypothetical protein
LEFRVIKSKPFPEGTVFLPIWSYSKKSRSQMDIDAPFESLILLNDNLYGISYLGYIG